MLKGDILQIEYHGFYKRTGGYHRFWKITLDGTVTRHETWKDVENYLINCMKYGKDINKVNKLKYDTRHILCQKSQKNKNTDASAEGNSNRKIKT